MADHSSNTNYPFPQPSRSFEWVTLIQQNKYDISYKIGVKVILVTATPTYAWGPKLETKQIDLGIHIVRSRYVRIFDQFSLLIALKLQLVYCQLLTSISPAFL
jgi:hypothetical protein